MIRVPSGRLVFDEAAAVGAHRNGGDNFERGSTIQVHLQGEEYISTLNIVYRTDSASCSEEEQEAFENDWEFISKALMDELEDDD
jgi:hypothetical protein